MTAPDPIGELLDHLQQAIGRHEELGSLAFKVQNIRAAHQTTHQAALDRIAELEGVVVAFVDEQCDYMRINKLGDPEKQHNIKRARAVLAKGDG